MKKLKSTNLFDILIQLILGLAVVIFILMPFLSVFKESFIIDGNIDFSYYENILANKKLLINSLKLATLTSFFSIILATILAIYIYLSKSKVKKVFNLILLITLVSPPFVTSLSYITLFGRRGFITHNLYIIPGTFFGLGYLLYFKSSPLMITGTSIIVVLNVLFKQLPFSSRVGNTAMKSIDTDMINSLRDLGANTFYEIKDGIIPNIKPSLRISLINSFTTTMTTVGSIIFLVYPGKKLLTLVMFDVINSGRYGEGSVIALLIMVICIVFNLLINFIFGQGTLKERSTYVFGN